MKHLFANCATVGMVLSIMMVAVSCRKGSQKPTPPAPPRTVRYTLYTEQNFSTDNHTITFELWMRRKGDGRPLFDSSLASMKISEIPDKAHAIVIDKVVPPGNNDVDIQLAFLYTIQDVGFSWYLDSARAGELSHTIEYSFK